MRQCFDEDLPCWICGEEIVYVDDRGEWETKSPWSFSLDHYETKMARPDLEWRMENWRPSHKLCNHRRGARPPEFTVWIGSKELGRWEKKESDKKYERRIANEDRRYKILTNLIRQEQEASEGLVFDETGRLARKLDMPEALRELFEEKT